METIISLLKLLKVLSSSCTQVFAILRACDVIEWAWYIVLLPHFIFLGALALSAGLTAIANAAEERIPNFKKG